MKRIKENPWEMSKTATVAGYQGLRHVVTKEVTLFGELGEIWEYNDTHCRAVIFGLGDKSDKVVTFPKSKLKTYIKRLRVPALASTQRNLTLKYLEVKNSMISGT